MTKRIFRSIFVVAMAVLMAALSITMGALYNYFAQVQREQLRTQTVLAAQAVDDEGMEYLMALHDLNCRITWISADGTVRFDSEHQSEMMENHLEREEINEALETGFGESVRYSSTLMEQSVYAAQRLEDGTVLRLSVARHTMVTLLLGIADPLCVVLAVAIILSVWLANRLARKIVEPLNELDLDNPLSAGGYEELKPLLRRIDSQQRQLLGQSTELKRKQREFDTVTNNMNEGLVLMNDLCNVLTMNAAAAHIMGLNRPMLGINFRSLKQVGGLGELLDQALEGTHGEQIETFAGKIYQIDASPVKSGGKVTGVVLLMIDITQKREAEAHRREFTANVSHELKTPLHAISGYAEMLKTGLVQTSDVPMFSEKIYSETQRMVRLVEDILKLSHLEEESGGMQWETVDLYALAMDVARELTPTARKRNVELEVAGSSCEVCCIPHLASGIITNLCTNAIKYNKPGGSARVEICGGGEEAVLMVSDTGIGIAPEHQERIFERFYRVDKSHSKAVGGTGLGLSIVKHAVQILGARLELHSIVGEGTTIEVYFPKKRSL